MQPPPPRSEGSNPSLSATTQSHGFRDQRDQMSALWPASYRGRIPVKVRMAKDLGPDMWGIMPKGPRIWVLKDEELAVKCNKHGAFPARRTYS